MKTPWIIYGQAGEHIAQLRVGSVRFGRTMRAALEINRYTQGKVFISLEDSTNPPLASRYYAVHGATIEDQQARNRQQLVGTTPRFIKHDEVTGVGGRV